MYKPVIKWSGSKRPMANEIVGLFPKEIGTYYEPFCGGASVTACLLEKVEENKIRVGKIVCSDLNSDLIGLWNKIKESPSEVSSHYRKLWEELNGCNNGIAEKKAYFEKVRNRFNEERNPLDFLFLSRTCTNGLIRYNRKGSFNTSFHITRNGINPHSLDAIIYDWYGMLNKHNVEFRCCSFEDIHPKEGDVVFCDPPYANTKGMYFGGFDNKVLFKWLEGLPCKWLMTYDGRSGEKDNTYEVPTGLYKEHLYLKSGNSSLRRVIAKENDTVVYESLYKNY